MNQIYNLRVRKIRIIVKLVMNKEEKVLGKKGKPLRKQILHLNKVKTLITIVCTREFEFYKYFNFILKETMLSLQPKHIN